MRLSIDVTPEQHQRLKAIAALQGQSMRDYVLARILPQSVEEMDEEDESIRQLEAFLGPRIKAARGETITKSVAQIFEEVFQEVN